MKWIAMFLNALLLGTVIYLFATKGAPGKDEVFLTIILIAAPISCLIAIVFNGSESWISLYFKRKALEEKKKIEKLDGEKI